MTIPQDIPTEIEIVTAPLKAGNIAASGASQIGPLTDREFASTILLPRWVVYFQAALLGIIAATFFIFGLMVGCLTNNQGLASVKTEPCEITGEVEFESNDGFKPDVGAVVIFLPKQRRPEERSAGNLVSPADFQPLDNPGIEIVNRLGGAVVRTNAEGKFSVTVDGNRSGIDYFVLVVSKNKAGVDGDSMTKQQVAVIGTFFMPVDRVINGQAYYWTSFTARSDSEMGTVKF